MFPGSIFAERPHPPRVDCIPLPSFNCNIGVILLVFPFFRYKEGYVPSLTAVSVLFACESPFFPKKSKFLVQFLAPFNKLLSLVATESSPSLQGDYDFFGDPMNCSFSIHIVPFSPRMRCDKYLDLNLSLPSAFPDTFVRGPFWVLYREG